MVNRQSSSINWVLVFVTLVILSLFSAMVAGVGGDRLQVNILRLVPEGVEVNVSKNITYQVNVSLLGEAVDNITNISIFVSYPSGFLTFLNASVGVNSSNDSFVNISRLDSGTLDVVNITNGSSTIFNLTFRVRRNAKSFNFTIIANATNLTPGVADIGGIGTMGNATNITYNLTSQVFFSNYSAHSTNFSNFVFNVLAILNTTVGGSHVMLGNANGSVNWTNALNLSEINLDIQTLIGNGTVIINSSVLDPSVNTSAFIRLNNISGGGVTMCPVRNVLIFRGSTSGGANVTTHPDLLRGAGEDCVASGECRNVTCAGDVLSFTVSHFSAYIANGNANLSINNSALPLSGRRSGTGLTINFTANYTNATLLEDINATCFINLTQGFGDAINANMSQKTTEFGPAYNFSFTPNRTQIGVFAYNITCDSPVFSQLVANLTYNVTDNVNPEVVNVTPNSNQTFNQSLRVGLTAVAINISAYVVDPAGGVGVDKVFVNITFPNGSLVTQQLTQVGGTALYSTDFDQTVHPFKMFGQYNITIIANDTEGNTNASNSTSFFINDSYVPRVLNISPNNTNISVGQVINFSANVSDNFNHPFVPGGSNISTVLVNITLPESLQVISIRAVPIGDIFIVNFSNTTQSGRYNYTVDANDSYNNRNATQGAFFVQSSSQTNTSSANSTVANSTVANSTIQSSNVSNSNVSNSDVANSTVNNASVQTSTVNRSNFENSSVGNSSIDESNVNQSQVENSTVSNSTVTDSNVNKSQTDNSSVTSSNVTSSNVNNSFVQNSTSQNSSITSSNINQSNVQNSSVSNSTVMGSTVNQTTTTNSNITGSNLSQSNINQSQIQNSTSQNSTISKSIVNQSNVQNSTVANSTVSGSTVNETITDNSSLVVSNVSDSQVNKSSIQNSTIIKSNITTSTINKSFIDPSTIENSTVSGDSTVLDSSVYNSTVNNATTQNATVNQSIVENSSMVFSNSTHLSIINRTSLVNSTVDFSNLTGGSILQESNVTNVRASRANLTRVNATHIQITNSTVLDSSILVSGDTTPALANVENSNITFTTSSLSENLVFNSTRSENVTGAGNVSFSCNRGLMEVYNLNMSAFDLQSVVFCSNLLNITSSATTQGFGGTGFRIEDSSINFTRGIQNGTVIRNASITFVNLLTNSTVTSSFLNDSTLNSSDVLNGSSIMGSNITSSIIENSSIYESNISRRSVINRSLSENSTIEAATVDRLSRLIFALVNSTGKTTLIDNSTVDNSTVADSFVVNSTIFITNVTNLSQVNRTFARNSTIVFSNVTGGSILFATNLTAVRASGSNLTRVNATHIQITNSTVLDSNLLVSVDTTPALANVENSNITFTTSSLSENLVFNSTRSENVTGAGNVTFSCNRGLMEVYNLNMSAFDLQSVVFCSYLVNITSSATTQGFGGTGFRIEDSSINFTRGIQNGTVIRNSTISNVNLLTNSTVIKSFLNDTTLNASDVLNGSSVSSSNISSSTIENSSVVKTNVSARSILNSSNVDNSTIVNSNVTFSTIIESNLTASRLLNTTVRISNITHMQLKNSSVINSSLLSSTDAGPEAAGVENSTLLRVNTPLSAILLFNKTNAENVSGIGNFSSSCNQIRVGPTLQNVIGSVFTGPSNAYCSDLLFVNATGATIVTINDSILQGITQIDQSALRNATVNHSRLIFNSTIVQSFINDTTLNASDVFTGSSVESSNVSSSKIHNSSLVKSNVSRTSVLNNTKLDNSTVIAANVTNSTVILSVVYSDGPATKVVNSTVRTSAVYNSSVFNSTLISSNVTDSFVTRSFVDPSTIVNSTVDEGSNITDSKIENSTIIGSNMTNCIVNNSRVNGSGCFNSNISATSNITNVTRIENVSLSGVTLVNIPSVSDNPSFLVFNTTFETTVNVTRNATYRLVINNTMFLNITNSTVTVNFNAKHLNYSVSSPGSTANGTGVVSVFVNNSPLVPGGYIEVNFTFVALANHTNLSTIFNVTSRRSDGAIKQINNSINITIVAPAPTQVQVAAGGFNQSNTDQENLTTDLRLVPDISNVSGFQLGNQNGTVNWTGGTVNAIGGDGRALPLSENSVRIGNGSIAFNTSAFHPSFNISARVTFFGVGCPSRNLVPIVNQSEFITTLSLIQAGGRDCISVGACSNISCAGGATGNMSFTVNHFTSFASSGNANLTINSTGPQPSGTEIVYNASYVNAATGAKIAGATCNISISDLPTTSLNMSEGVSTYSAARTASTAGTFTINVTCSATGFTTINALDNITITPAALGGGGPAGGGGGGYSRRVSAETELQGGVTTPPVTAVKPASQTAFDILDLIKSFYKGVKDYTAFQIIDIIKRFYGGK